MINNVHTVINEPHWGILVAIYYFLVAVSSGSIMAVLLAGRFGVNLSESSQRTSFYIALVSFLIAPPLLIAELMQPMRFLSMINPMNFNPSSPMSWGGLLLGLYGLTLLYYMYKRGWLTAASQSKAIGETAASVEQSYLNVSTGLLLLAAALALLPPAELIVVNAKVFWRSELLPVYFFTTTLLAGTSVLGLVAGKQTEKLAGVGKIMVLMLSLTILWIAIRAIGLSFGGAEAALALSMWWSDTIFLGGELIVGTLAPLALLLMSKNKVPNTLVSLLVLVGVFAMRYVVVFIGNAAILP